MKPSDGYHAVRGILCVRCNIGGGQYGHNPEHLRAAADYFEAANRRLR
jgi:hypothetical protein